MYHQFNTQFYVLPTECIYVFRVDLRTNSDYFSSNINWLIVGVSAVPSNSLIRYGNLWQYVQMKFLSLFATIMTEYYALARINLGCEVRGVDLKTEAKPEGISAVMLYLHTGKC